MTGYKIYCEVPAEERKGCPWMDNGYCHYIESQEVNKRKRIAVANNLDRIQGVCSQTREVE